MRIQCTPIYKGHKVVTMQMTPAGLEQPCYMLVTKGAPISAYMLHMQNNHVLGW